MSERKGSVGDGLLLLWVIALFLYAVTHGYTVLFLAGTGVVLVLDQVARYVGRRRERGK